MSHLKALLCCAAVFLAGCDDPKISNLSRRLMLLESDITKMTGRSQILVEVHGVPWEGATKDATARTIRMPEGPSREVRFVNAAPGDSRIGEDDRLVLHFNPVGEPDSAVACHTYKELPSEKNTGPGFTVHVSVCRGDEWILQAFMKSSAERSDWLAYYLAFEKLLTKLFPGQ